MAQSRMVAKNTFGEGLIMDFAPDNVQANVLTNALNATLLTYNGNEMSLQNDMGNGRVETAFLPEGYVPMGVCEFGGIIYIVSYNPQDNLCQIGSFPSPERNITKEDRLPEDLKPSPIVNSYFQEISNGTPTGKIKALVSKVVIREDSLNPGDKYIIQSNRDSYTDSDLKSLSGLAGDGRAKRLKLSIVSVEDSGKITKLETLNYNVNTTQGNKEFNILNDNSISSNVETDIDAYRQNLKQNYNVFSARIPGKLAILAELEVITNFSCSHRIVTKTNKINTTEYTTYDVYLDYKWESNDPTINPKYITLTDFTWESNLKGQSFAKYYDENGSEITLNLDCTYSTNNFNPSSNISGKTMHINLPKLIEGQTSYFYHTITSRGQENFDNYIYRNSIFTKDHKRQMNFSVKTDNFQENKKLTVGEQLGEIEVNNKLGLSNTTYLFSITVPSKFDTYIFRLPYKLHYEITPAMEFGLLEHLAVDNEIDFSLIGTKVIQPTGIKYFTSQDLVTINIDNEIYEEENHKVTNMILEFYDINGFCGSYFFEDRESYAGNIVTNIPFNSIYLRKYKFSDIKGNQKEDIREWYHNIQGEIEKVLNAPVEKGEDTGDCGILFSNLLYGVKLLYVYSQLNPITQEVENTETIEKGFWLYTNGQFNDYYYSVDNYSSIKFQLPLIYSFKMQDKTYKENIKLSEETKTNLNKLLNATYDEIDQYNANKSTTYALTTLVDYTGDIDLEINVGLAEGQIYSLIEQNNDIGATISLELLSPYEKEKTFSIVELKKEEEENKNDEETTEQPNIYKNVSDRSKIYLTNGSESIKLNGKFSANTKIRVEIPELKFITIPTEYKKQMINTTILTPVLYKYEEDNTFNYDDIGGETMFQKALCYVGSDDEKSDSGDYASDDRWFETSINLSDETYDSLLYEYPAGKRHTNLVDGHESLIQHYNSLGNRQPFTLFTVQMPEYSATSKYGYFPKWSYNIIGAGSVCGQHKDERDYETTPKANDCYIIRQEKDLSSDFVPYYKNRQYIPAFINNRIAEGGHVVLMSSSGGKVSKLNLLDKNIYPRNGKNTSYDILPYTAHTSSQIRNQFYSQYKQTMKELLTVNADYKNCEIGTFEYSQDSCKNLQAVSVVTATFNPSSEFLSNAKNIATIHGIQFSRYINLLLNRMQSVLTANDNNVALEFDLSQLGKDNRTVITYINYTMLHEHGLIDSFLDFENSKFAKFLNGYYCKDTDKYEEKWLNYVYKIDEFIQESKFYMAYADTKDGTIKFKQVGTRTHQTDSYGHIKYNKIYDVHQRPTTSNIGYYPKDNSIFYNTTMRIDDFTWDPYNNKHHFYFNKDSSLTMVDSKFSYQLDDDATEGKDRLIVRPYYIGPSFTHKFT